MWANIWAAVSALATVATFVVALLAMQRWSKQEELKVKLEFKLAVSAYAYCLVSLPVKLNSESVKTANEDMCDELTDLLAKATPLGLQPKGYWRVISLYQMRGNTFVIIINSLLME